MACVCLFFFSGTGRARKGVRWLLLLNFISLNTDWYDMDSVFFLFSHGT